MGRTLSRVAGVVFAGALVTFAAAPAALAQTETETTTASPTETTTSGTTAPPATGTTTPSSPVTTTGTTSAPATTEVTPTTTPKPTTTTTTTETSEPPKDDYQDNTGAGFIGTDAEGVLIIYCAAGAPGDLATQYLTVTGGPDQDGADGRKWGYTVRVVDAPTGTTTAKFSWTCGGVEGNGIVEFLPEEPPATSTSTATSVPASSTAPVTTATSAASGNSAPKAQVKVAPKGGIETGFGGTAW